MKPPLGRQISAGKKPSGPMGVRAGAPPEPAPKISFSYEHWGQTEYFGLSNVDVSWIVTLTARLAEINRMTRDQFNNEALTGWGAARWHYHKVDFAKPNVSIKRAALQWVPKVILDNDEEFPMWQFGLGRTQGRVIGYWETEERFVIVMYDPHHNLYPSEGLDDCAAAPDSVQAIKASIEEVRKQMPCANSGGCQLHKDLGRLVLIGGAAAMNVLSVPCDATIQSDVAGALEIDPSLTLRELMRLGVEAFLKSRS